MSSYHNLRMGVLRLSEYLDIIDEDDETVRRMVHVKRTKLEKRKVL